ncbi:MATE family efflux transporter [Lachnospiraceae bacterium NSJ-143]|nr:MATE family efflux transporter [Lachnospiraceae bacterium NSJ-143]
MTADTGKNIKNIFSLSIPIIVENLLQTLLGVTDTYFAGKIADIAIAGIGVTNLVMNILIAFFTALTVGTVAITARNYGRKDYKRVNSSIMHSIVLGIALGGCIRCCVRIVQNPYTSYYRRRLVDYPVRHAVLYNSGWPLCVPLPSAYTFQLFEGR